MYVFTRISRPNSCNVNLNLLSMRILQGLTEKKGLQFTGKSYQAWILCMCQAIDATFRPAYLEALIPLLDPSVTAFNKRLKSLTQSPSGRNILHFTDGATHEADLVIGADGIKSVSRIAVVGEGNNNLGFSNTHAYRGLVPIDTLLAAGVKPDKVQLPLIWTGVGKVRYVDAHLYKHSLTCPGI
jgi:hypothetical protein